jgi:hypothetical protein
MDSTSEEEQIARSGGGSQVHENGSFLQVHILEIFITEFIELCFDLSKRRNRYAWLDIRGVGSLILGAARELSI